MGQQTQEVAASQWHDELERLTKEHHGDDATIEVLSDLGAQPESERLALAYLEYDHKDDVVIVAVGPAGDLPVLRHVVARPRTIYVSSLSDAELALDIEAADRSRTLVTLFRHPPDQAADTA
jgi:hypothetical protein